MKVLIKLYLLALISITGNLMFGVKFLTPCFAQDVNSSQFQYPSLTLNPALTGVFIGDMRVLVNYRNQWSDKTAPYTTLGISYDAGIMKKDWKKGFLGTGITVFNDQSGDSKIRTMQVAFFLSGNKILNENSTLSAGVQAGFSERNIMYNKLAWENQYYRNGLDPALFSDEANSSYKFIYGDFATGFNWSYGRGGKYSLTENMLKANAGIALFHFNRPEQYFMEIDRLYPKLVVYGDMYIGIKKHLAVLPGSMFMKQGSIEEISLGTMLRYVLKEESKYTNRKKGAAIAFGGYYRSGDAIIVASQVEFSAYALGISYDMITSGLKPDISERGGFELSLKYVNPGTLGYRKPSANPRY